MMDMVHRQYLQRLYNEAEECLERLDTVFSEMGLIAGGKNYSQGDCPPFLEMNEVILALMRDGRRQLKDIYEEAKKDKIGA